MTWGLLLLALASPAPAQETAPPAISTALLAGRYEYRDREITASVDLRPDGSFSYAIDGLSGEPTEPGRWTGRWRTRSANKIVLENAPGAAPFYFRGMVRSLADGLIEIEAGQAGIPMRRTGPAR